MQHRFWPARLTGQMVTLLLIALVVSQAALLLIFVDIRRGAPIPTLAPDFAAPPEKPAAASPIRSEQASWSFDSPYGYYPFFPSVIIHKKFPRDRSSRREFLRRPDEFPHTIFRIGESPAEKGAGVFPRR